jgi:type IX secretion system PorP/SprF family membrane protein
MVKDRARTFICHIVMVLVFAGCIYAQKEPQYTQYMYNIGTFNPAYVGTVETPDITGLYRAQWTGIPGAPRTLRFGVNYPLPNEKNGLGFNVVNDQLGPTSQTYIDVAYSFQVNVAEDMLLSFGIDAGGSLLNVDFSKGDFQVENDPLLITQNVNSFYPTIGAGLFLYQDYWYLGLSVPNFLTDGIYNDEVAGIVEDKQQFNFIGGYVFDINEDLKFKPAFLINYLSGSPVNLNLSANFLIRDTFTAGLSYRLDNAVSGLAGFQVSGSTFIGYSYDYNTNALGDYAQGSHEIIVKFYLGSVGGFSRDRSPRVKEKGRQIDSPRFF